VEGRAAAVAFASSCKGGRVPVPDAVTRTIAAQFAIKNIAKNVHLTWAKGLLHTKTGELTLVAKLPHVML
jgi:hypothetical protein